MFKSKIILAATFIAYFSNLILNANCLDCTKIPNTNSICLRSSPTDCSDVCLAKNCETVKGKCLNLTTFGEIPPHDSCAVAAGSNKACLFDCNALAPTGTCYGLYPGTTSCLLFCGKNCLAENKYCSIIPGNLIDGQSDEVCLYDQGSVCASRNKAVVECIFANKKITENTKIVLNVGDALMIQCKAHGGGGMSPIDNNRIPGFIITKNASPTSAIVKLATPGSPPIFSINNGYLVYDSITGNAKGHDHIAVRSHMPFYKRPLVASGYFSMYIPYVSQGDAATYYICFMDGSEYTNVDGPLSLGVSYAISLQVNTKQNSGASSKLSNMLMTASSLMALPAINLLK